MRSADEDVTRRLDEPLLRALLALLDEASVSQAARRLGLAQSAMSRHLASLRRLTGDELLVRVGNRMVLTERARTLITPTRRILADMSLLVANVQPRPLNTLRMSIRIATYDFLPKAFFAEVTARIAQAAPGCDLVFRGLGSRFEHYRQLADGEVDLVVTVWPELPPHLRATSLLNEPLVCLMRQGHPLAPEGALTLHSYQRARHLGSLEHVPGQGTIIDNRLMELGVVLDTAVHTQFLSLAPAILARTDLVFTTGRLLAEAFAREEALVIVPFPAPIAPMRYRLVWHERTHADSALRWVREELVGVARAMAQRSPGDP
ncbi:LysR family transcriptional regulator [Xenophilus arseniciresistens]|uniref:LysR family transcriptional regulator n=1 Tax=Xenophilus arseniciresistens TaxID=1283306 RepID=A0AAE3N6A7_9BURK|nr:LysR family transcriptional regulator [Xenophilus arseniciresistens]MDA7415151.1 LysR family transcriptional regulator [Xenophilus arseniciresistens]